MSYGCLNCEHLQIGDFCHVCWLEDRGLYDHEITYRDAPYWCPREKRSKEWINDKLKRRGKYLNSLREDKNGKVKSSKRRKR